MSVSCWKWGPIVGSRTLSWMIIRLSEVYGDQASIIHWVFQNGLITTLRKLAGITQRSFAPIFNMSIVVMTFSDVWEFDTFLPEFGRKSLTSLNIEIPKIKAHIMQKPCSLRASTSHGFLDEPLTSFSQNSRILHQFNLVLRNKKGGSPRSLPQHPCEVPTWWFTAVGSVR